MFFPPITKSSHSVGVTALFLICSRTDVPDADDALAIRIRVNTVSRSSESSGKDSSTNDAAITYKSRRQGNHARDASSIIHSVRWPERSWCFMAIVPLAFAAFGNFVVRCKLASPDMRFRGECVALLTSVCGGRAIMFVIFFLPGARLRAGWTSYFTA